MQKCFRPGLGAALAAIIASAPGAGIAEIVWSGDFDDYNFLNYHRADDPNAVTFAHVPDYGRPIQYGSQVLGHVGNGHLLSLVSSPTRGGKYAAKFTIKNSANGSEKADCDPATDCSRRRSQLQMTKTLLQYYKAIPQGKERWLSLSVYLPSNFVGSGSGFGPVIWGSKGSAQKMPGAFGIQIDNNDSWRLIHRYYSAKMNAENVNFSENWWLATDYTKDYPSKSAWEQGLVDFPDVAASKAALANLNRGGWTDFIWHFKTDIDEFEDNTGFLDVYMRADSGPWVHVLKIRPMKNLARDPRWVKSNPERVYDRGIGQYGPGGYVSVIGLYAAKGRVWGHKNNMDVYIDNHKVGDEHSSFALMTHDGSTFDGSKNLDTPPRPPVIVQAE